MKKKIFFYILIFFYLSIKQVASLENKIILKVNNKIITTFDVVQEEKYLKVLNPQLNKLNRNKIKNLATDSIVKEKIKEIELVKYYEIEKVLDDVNLKEIIKNLYQTIGFKEKEEFKNYLNTQNLKYSSVKKKLAIEMLWNNLIYEKFNNRVIINENEIRNDLDQEIKKIKFSRDVFLSEILIKNSKDLELEVVYSEILKSIENVGFAEPQIFLVYQIQQKLVAKSDG